MAKQKFLLLFIIVLAACRQPGITGHWKLLPHANNKAMDSIVSINADAGDLTLLSDSTYLIKGISSKVSDTPGWHTGGDEKGSWKGSTKDTLVLLSDDLRSFIPESWRSHYSTAFKIVQLSHTELVLAALDSTRNMRIDSLIKYRRD